MPRGKGGSREGTKGVNYPNRSDLRGPKMPSQVAPSTQYGRGVAQERAIAAMPMGAPPPPPAAEPRTATPLDAPTARPDEHVMSGAPVGPGPGPEVLGISPNEDVEAQLRAAYARYPTEQLRALIEMIDDGDV